MTDTAPPLQPPAAAGAPSGALPAGRADYAGFLQQHLASQTFNVVRYELPGESVWLKKAGPAIAAWRYRTLGLLSRLLDVPVLQLGLPDVFIEHGDPVKLMAMQGLDAAGIERSIRERFAVPQAASGQSAAA